MKKSILGILSLALISGSSLSYASYDMTQDNTVGGRSITAFDRVGERAIGGYFDNEFYALNSGKQTFKAHRFVLQVSSQVHERVLVNTEIEFEYGGFIKGNSSNTNADGELKLEQGWADFTIVDDHYFRTGIVLVPFGIVNILHDSDMRDATMRPIYAKYIVPSTWMDTGAGFHGKFDIGEVGFVYDAYIINGLDENISTLKGLSDARQGFKEDNNQSSAFAGHISVSPALSFQIGASIYTGKYSLDNEDGLTLLGIDGTWSHGPFEFVGEAAQATIDGFNNMNGYYGEARYHFFPDFLKNSFLGKGFSHPTFTLFTRYSAVDLDVEEDTEDDKSQFTFGINYRPTPTVVLKMEGELNREDNKSVDSSGFIASMAVGF